MPEIISSFRFASKLRNILNIWYWNNKNNAKKAVSLRQDFLLNFIQEIEKTFRYYT